MVVTYSLCALLMLTVCGTSNAQSINITITGGISPAAMLGTTTSYTLTCTANSTNVTWTSYPAGAVGSLTTSGSTTSRPLTLPSPVVLSYAGLYVCTASTNGVSTTASYAFNVTVMQVTIGNTVPQLTGTVGGSIAIICSASIGGTNDKPLDFQWIGPTGVVMSSSGRIYVENVTTTQNQGFTFYTSTLIFSTLSSQDNNSMYQCSVGTVYTPYSTQYTPSSSMTTVVVSALTLSPTISGPSCQQAVLQLNCTAAKPLSVVPPVVFSWYRGSGGIFSPLGPGVPGTNVTPQGANVSTLTIAGSSVGGSYVYQCEASVAVPDDVPVVAYATTGVVNFSLFGMVSGLTVQSSGRLVWQAPVVNCNTFSYYTFTMTMYSDGTLVEMGTTTQQNYTLTRSYAAGIPFIATVWAIFGTTVGGNTSQIVFSQELAPSGTLNITVTSINGSTILLSWKPLSPVKARGFVRYYLVTWTPGTRGTRGTTGGGTANLTADTTTFLITGLDPMVTYMVSVSAGTIAGVGATTNTTIITQSLPSLVNVLPYKAPCGTSYMTCAIPIAVVLPVVTLVAIILLSAVLYRHYRYRVKAHDTGTEPISLRASQLEAITEEQLGPQDPDISPAPPRGPITCGDTYIDASELRTRINELHKVLEGGNCSGFEEQFELLGSMDTLEYREQDHVNKNYYENDNLSRARLRPTGVQGSEYINASCIDGYKLRNAYIAAQAPLMNTVEDFWRMVWEFKSMTIVMLCGLDEDRVVQYWPMRPGETLVYGKMSVTLMVTSNKSNLTRYELQLKEEKVPTPCSTVHLYHYTGWPHNSRPASCGPIIQISKKVLLNDDSRCITVLCNDGMGRTGAFITIHAMMERLKTEHVVDFFQFIKSSRIRRPNFVTTMEQYIFCHEVVADFVDSKRATPTQEQSEKSRPQSYSTEI